MSIACTSCGHLIPAGQVRCAQCGEPAPREAEPPSEEPPEAAVPKGTFASVAPQPTPALVARPESAEARALLREQAEARALSREQPKDESRPLASTGREPAEAGAARNAALSSSQRIKQVAKAVRPPFLASESLREDLSPISPGQQTLFYTLQLAGLSGCLASAAAAFDHPVGWLCALVCLGVATLSRLELDYKKRAILVAAIAGSALILVSGGRMLLGAGADDPLLVVACSFLPAALLFRSWYRGARIARALVGATLVLAFAWAALTSHRGLLALGFTWQSWLPALAWSLFCILCLLSLLAFMGDETTGGCHVWAFGISIWFGLFASLRWAMERDGFGPESRALAAALGLTEAALASALAIALAQLGARLYVSRSRLLPNQSRASAS